MIMFWNRNTLKNSNRLNTSKNSNTRISLSLTRIPILGIPSRYFQMKSLWPNCIRICTNFLNTQNIGFCCFQEALDMLICDCSGVEPIDIPWPKWHRLTTFWKTSYMFSFTTLRLDQLIDNHLMCLVPI